MRRAFALFACWFSLATLVGQIRVGGTIQDAGSGEYLGYARISTAEYDHGSLSDAYGRFGLSMPAGSVTLVVQLAGYQTHTISLTVLRDTLLTILLRPYDVALDTIAIEAVRSYGIESALGGGLVIPIRQLKQMPAIGGESDVLKAIQMLPGIQMGHEGTAGVYVRGGSPDQNLILLDDIPVYNVNHLFGFFSLFHSEALKSAELLRGTFPAKYGGRLSSVINLRSREGSRTSRQGSVVLSPIVGRFTLEGPVLKQKGSFFVAGRRTWLDAIARPVSALLLQQQDEINGSLGYGFHDLIAKVNYQPSPHQQLFLSYYRGQDRAALSLKDNHSDKEARLRAASQLTWGNHTASLRYTHVHNPRLFSTVTLGFTQYRFLSENDFSLRASQDNRLMESYLFGHSSRISDLIAKSHHTLAIHPTLTLSGGMELSQKWFRPVIEIRRLTTDSSHVADVLPPPFTGFTGSLYAEADWQPHPRIRLYAGLRGEYFQSGGYTLPTLQPRLSLNIRFSDKTALKAGGGSVVQYLHLLTNTGVGLPTDLWVPATGEVPPERSWQSSVGLYQDLASGLYVAVEGYYKSMTGLIEYADGTSFLNAFDDWEDHVVRGGGHSLGVEFFLHKTTGRWQGWLSYTLSKTDRQFTAINGGSPFPFRFDRRHNLSVFATYRPRSDRQWAASWTYMSGAKASVPTYRFDIPENEFSGSDLTLNLFAFREFSFGQYATQLDSRNNFTLPPFHKLDLSYAWRKTKKRGYRQWVVSVYNAYGRFNPAGIFLEQRTIPDSSTPSGTRDITEIKALSYFRWVPSLSWERYF